MERNGVVDSKSFLTVVLPALNEEEAVGAVIDEIKEAGYERILLVDGHSVDRTVELSRERGVEVVFQEGEGKMGAIRTAIRRVDTPYFLVMDCDCTYDPKDIGCFLVDKERYDLTIGMRKDGRSNISSVNRLGNWVITRTFEYLLGSGLTDVCSGMYLLKTETARELEAEERGAEEMVEKVLKDTPVPKE